MKKQKLNDKRKIPPPMKRQHEPGVPDASRVIHSEEPNALDG